jgi:hypothetical protein
MIKAHEYRFALDKCSRGIVEGSGRRACARMEAKGRSARGKFKFCYRETVVICCRPELRGRVSGEASSVLRLLSCANEALLQRVGLVVTLAACGTTLCLPVVTLRQRAR